MLAKTVEYYLCLLGLRCDKDRLRAALIAAPSYPSLLSLKKALDFIGIEAELGKCDLNYIQNLNIPFLAHFSLKGKQTLSLVKRDNRKKGLSVFSPISHKWENMDIADFSQIWDGVTVIIKKDNKAAIRKNFSNIVLLISIFLISLILLELIGWEGIPLIFGCIFTSILFLNLLGKSDPLVDKLCNATSFTDCNTVSNSKYASFYGIHLSTLALTYFLSQLITFSFIIDNEASYPLLQTFYSVSALIVLPVCCYSFWTQFKINRLCTLCLFTLLSLIAEAIIAIHHYPLALNHEACFDWIIIGILIFAFLQALQGYSEKKRLSDRLHIKLLTFKRMAKTIQTESKAITIPDLSIHISEQSGKSTTDITAFISPSCNHCKETLAKILDLSESRKDLISLSIILGRTSANDVKIIREWISLYKQDKALFLQFLRKWCRNESTDFPVLNSSEKDYADLESSFNDTITKNRITSFPRLVINGRLFSTLYEPEDLEYLILDSQ